MNITHYMYTSENQQDLAKSVAQKLKEEGYLAKVEHLDYEDGQWVITTNIEVADIGTSSIIEDHIIKIANDFGIEYDGSETTIE